MSCWTARCTKGREARDGGGPMVTSWSIALCLKRENKRWVIRHAAATTKRERRRTLDTHVARGGRGDRAKLDGNRRLVGRRKRVTRTKVMRPCDNRPKT